MKAESWLVEHTGGAPDRLVASMIEAVRAVDDGEVPQQLAQAAILLYGQVVSTGEGREAALPLLAADALFTHAFEAQAKLDPEGLDAFADERANAHRLAQLLPMTGPDNSAKGLIARLEILRRAEKEQALLYRSLAAHAEEIDPPAAQRFHDLHADEQHHLSRLTARVLELGGRPDDLSGVFVDPGQDGDWQQVVAAREAQEIARYREELENVGADDTTHALLSEILEVEEHHARDLGGKWTMA